jgi:hypothetical protein
MPRGLRPTLQETGQCLQGSRYRAGMAARSMPSGVMRGLQAAYRWNYATVLGAHVFPFAEQDGVEDEESHVLSAW